MSNYKCLLTDYISVGWVESELYLNPKNYLYCKDLEELKECIYEDLDEGIDLGNVIVDDADSDYDIPDEFYKEWQRLKDEQYMLALKK